jgi:glucose-6-phosphate isomerase
MLTLDIKGTLAKVITPSHGIPDQEFSAVRSTVRRYTEEWLSEREKGMHAWSMNPYDKDMIKQVKDLCAIVKAERIDTVVWVGIGGSGLGPKVLQEVFETPETPGFIVIDTIDPATLAMHLKLIDWKNALLVVVSKSGNTLETMSAFFACFEKLKEAVKTHPGNRVVAITDPEEGPLRAFASSNRTHALALPSAVGGRYSIFTPVGLFALGLLNGDIDQFVRGAKEMDTHCQETTLARNPAASLAAVQYLLDTRRGYPIRVIMPYGDRLQSMARWEQQLLAESLGKTDGFNPIPVAAIGTQDQHSLLQQWMAGPRKSWHLFLREVDKPRLEVPRDLPEPFGYLSGKTFGQLLDACYEGTSQALTSAKRPHVTLALQRLDEYHIGQLFFLFLTEVVYLGKLYRIDVYGQPAVEIGKQITKGILSKGHNN